MKDSFSQSFRLNSFISKALSITLLLYGLLLAVRLLSTGFSTATGDNAQVLFTFATNPFLGLMVGVLSTALIQSSSTVTSIIVSLVAGGLPISLAIPMVMGANIGTTITNTFVSLGHIGDRTEFKRAFAAATIHDFFNLLAVILFLPLEISTHFLEKISFYLTQLLSNFSGFTWASFDLIEQATAPLISLLEKGLEPLNYPFNALVFVALGLGGIIGIIVLLGKVLKKLLTGKAQQLLHQGMGKNGVSSILIGTGITLIVQSSSTTTSLIVPLAGSNLLTLEEVYPFTLGANIGTCITAILAATAISGNAASSALQIALVHFLYNTFGVIFIYGLPLLRPLPLISSRFLAYVASEKKPLALLYLVTVFFLIPGLLLFGFS